MRNIDLGASKADNANAMLQMWKLILDYFVFKVKMLVLQNTLANAIEPKDLFVCLRYRIPKEKKYKQQQLASLNST